MTAGPTGATPPEPTSVAGPKGPATDVAHGHQPSSAVPPKLAAATRNAVVAFEVDDIDADAHSGWSVVVQGVAREVTDFNERADAQRHVPARWAPGSDSHVVAISTEIVSGRRMVPGLSAPAGARE